MRKTDREEIAQWLDGMMAFSKEYDLIVFRLSSSWQKGAVSYNEVFAEGELPTLLEKVRGMPIPRESKCKSAKKNFEKAIDAQEKGRAALAKYGEGLTISSRMWTQQIMFWLDTSEIFQKAMAKDCVSLGKRYQI
jgi:hypothetical protein